MLIHFGEFLQEKRTAIGLSKRELAERINLSSQEVSEIERCASLPKEGMIVSIAHALALPPDELLLQIGVLPDWIKSALEKYPSEVLKSLEHLKSPGPDKEDEPIQSYEPAFQTCLGKLYRIDCVKFMKTLLDDSIDCIFADPPFNLDKDYGPGILDRRRDESYWRWSVDWMSHAVRVLRPGGSFFLYNIPKWNLRLGEWLRQRLEFRHWIAVDIKFSLPIPQRLYPSHYSMLYFVKGTAPSCFTPPRLPIQTCRHCGGEMRDYGGYKGKMNPKGVNLTDVWTDLSPVRHKKFKTRAANELPLKMLDRVLDIATREGDLILDPFGGSGTTYVAAELRDRRWLGSEIGEIQPIIARFEKIGEEREHLAAVRARINTLFTEEAMKLRAVHNHDSSRYRLLEQQKSVSEVKSPSLFEQSGPA